MQTPFRWIVFAMAGSACAFGSGRQAEPHLTLLRAAKDGLLMRALYSHPGRIVSRVAPSGAVGTNAEYERGSAPRWFIETQRYGADLVQAGCAAAKPEQIQEGWRILKWGLSKQGPTGTFPGTGDPFHSTAFFVEGLARALTLQRQAQLQGGDAPELEQKAKAAAYGLLEPGISRNGIEHNRPYAHRRWLVAAALGETGHLLKDSELIRKAAEFARDGIDIQRPDGIDPEKGGGDVNYQALGLLEAGRYALTLSDKDALRGSVVDVIRKGLDWELTKIGATGHVDVEGSTRTEQERGRGGEIKSIDYKIIVQALVMGSSLTGNSRYHEAAEKICRERNWLD